MRLSNVTFGTVGNTAIFPPAGRLEVNLRNRFGTVCRDGFTLTSANVICQQMGFSRADRWTNIAQRWVESEPPKPAA